MLTHRIIALLSEEEFTAVDDWRFKRRIASRGEAVRQLLKRGLEAIAIDEDRPVSAE